MQVQAADLWPVILDFVETNFGEDDLESFKKYFKLDINHKVKLYYWSNKINRKIQL
jgi:hypothetical protein